MPFREIKAPQSLFIEIRNRMKGWNVEKANTDTRKPEVWCTICANIQESRAVIADLSSANPNVLLELGIVFGMGRPFVLLTQDYNDLTFDTQGFLVQKYSRDSSESTRVAKADSLVRTISDIIENAPEITPELFDASREGRLYRRIIIAKKIASDYWKKEQGNWSVKDVGDSIDKVVVCMLDKHPVSKNAELIAKEVNISKRQVQRIVSEESSEYSKYFDRIDGGYRLSDIGVYWAIETILPELPKES